MSVFRAVDLDTGWWFSVERDHDVIALQWVIDRGVWIKGAGPLDDAVKMSHDPVPHLATPENRADAERIARRHLDHIAGTCPRCHGHRWVCENHPDQPWYELAAAAPCCGGAGAPCPDCHPWGTAPS